MLAYGTELLKAIIPTSISDYLPDTSSTNENSHRMETTLPPVTPFCCVSTIPASFRYVAELLPASTSHNVLAKPLTGTPLTTAFLLYATNCYHNPYKPCGKEVVRAAAVNLYYAIVQLTATKSSATSTVPAVSSKLPRLANAESSRRRSSSAASTFGLSPIEEGFMDIVLAESSTSSQYVSAKLSSSSFSSFHPSPSTSTQPASEDKEIKYYVPIENSQESTILSEAQKLKGSECKKWKGISERDAMESLRLPGSGVVIGDGEVWRELGGVERLVCRAHGMEFEIRAWVRES